MTSPVCPVIVWCWQCLEDIVILRLMKGSDFFVVVSGRLDVHHVEEARKSVRSIVVANPISKGKNAVVLTSDSVAAAERQSGRYPRTDVRNTSSLARTEAEEHSEDEEDDEEIALEDIYGEK